MKTGIAVVTTEQLQELVTEAVRSALAECKADPDPVLMDRHAAAKALGISPTQLDRLRARGLPTVLVGSSPRFVLADCLNWLKEQK